MYLYSSIVTENTYPQLQFLDLGERTLITLDHYIQGKIVVKKCKRNTNLSCLPFRHKKGNVHSVLLYSQQSMRPYFQAKL